MDEPCDVSELMRRVRAIMGWSQAEEARQLDLSPSTISEREKGVRGVPPDELQRLAGKTNLAFLVTGSGWAVVEPEEASTTAAVLREAEQLIKSRRDLASDIQPPSDLMTWFRERGEQLGSTDAVDVDIEIPIAAQVGAGPGVLVDEYGEQMTEAALRWVADVDALVKVRGTSMQPVYHDGDVIGMMACDERSVRQGRLVVARWRDDGSSLVKVYRGRKGGRLLLQSLNPIHDIIIDDEDELEVIGRPFGLLRVREMDWSF